VDPDLTAAIVAVADSLNFAQLQVGDLRPPVRPWGALVPSQRWWATRALNEDIPKVIIPKVTIPKKRRSWAAALLRCVAEQCVHHVTAQRAAEPSRQHLLPLRSRGG
jgi:hypothetical protein